MPATRKRQKRQEVTGHFLNAEAQCEPDVAPLETQWISEAMIARTMDVWARYLGRNVDREEATEMLLNVQRIALAFYQNSMEGACE